MGTRNVCSGGNHRRTRRDHSAPAWAKDFDRCCTRSIGRQATDDGSYGTALPAANGISEYDSEMAGDRDHLPRRFHTSSVAYNRIDGWLACLQTESLW